MSIKPFYRRSALCALMLACVAPSPSALAADFVFNTAPFAGSTALQTPGRQVVGGERIISNFNLNTDRLVFDPAVFGVSPQLTFFNSLGASLPRAGADFIVLRDIDADGNTANGILNNAGLSANLIAANAFDAGPGFFLYFNTALNLNRLVYSTDLGNPTSDLQILARFTDQTGTAGAAALQQFSAENIAAVPEPATWMMMIAGFGAIGGAMRRRTKNMAAGSA